MALTTAVELCGRRDIETIMNESNFIHLDARAIPGLVFRPFLGAADYPCLVAVREGTRAYDQLAPASPQDAIPTVDELAQRLTDQDIDGPAILVVEINGTVIGYNQIVHAPGEGGSDVYFHRGWLLPAWRGRGIGRRMLRSAEGRLRTMARAHPSSCPAVFATTVSSTEREAVVLVQNEGYRPVWQIRDMIADTTTPRSERPLPHELSVRALRPEHYHALFLAARDAWSALPFATDDEHGYLGDTVRLPGFDPTLCQVAWTGEDVVGLVLTQRNKGEGFILDVAVREAWQRHGIARALLLQCLNGLAAHGMTIARLYVDAESVGAQQLYDSIGFQSTKEHRRYQKPLVLPVQDAAIP